MTKKIYDTIVIGAGFGGVTSVRELSQKGLDVLLIEARNRIGGRTWVDSRLGHQLEMGGTWVHWFQAHIWSEISRYGLKVVPSPVPEKAYWIVDDKRYEGTPEELYKIINTGMEKFLKDTFKYFPFPHNPFQSDKLKEIDHLSVRDRLNKINLTKEEYDLVESVWALLFNGKVEDASLTQAYRWAAMANNDFKLLMEVLAAYKLQDGTKALINSIFNDIEAEVLFNKTVSKILKEDNIYKVISSKGDEFYSHSIICTVPLNTLNKIDFQPSLPDSFNQAMQEGSSTNGFKSWAKVKNINIPFEAWAPQHYPITYAQLEIIEKDYGIVVSFGTDAKELDVNNKEEVEKALSYFIPNIEVIEVTGNDWSKDPFAQGTWYMQRPNHLTEYLKELHNMDDGLYFVGSDYGGGAQSLMDGAIESAFHVSRKVIDYLKR